MLCQVGQVVGQAERNTTRSVPADANPKLFDKRRGPDEEAASAARCGGGDSVEAA